MLGIWELSKPVLDPLKNLDFFRAVLGSQQNVERVPIYSFPCSTHLDIASSITDISCQSFKCVTTDEPTLTLHYQHKSVANVGVHSWFRAFCGFGHTYNDVDLPLQYLTGVSLP